jgi:NTP pyrophosphatase (non-canonical NTP hydrolase)
MSRVHIGQLQNEVEKLLKEKGFDCTTDSFWEKVALNHTEISELADLIKKEGINADKAKIGGEIADIIIRAMNFGIMFNIDVESAIEFKMKANFNRPYKYNTHLEGGKPL